ncbi:MAG: DUF86 domain-containing protein [Actinobacteria bacterium]|nr:DUF86 domain-containing protein [Actinomycetota bacterium]
MSRDEDRLVDMLRAARRARSFVSGMNEEAFHQSELHQSAVVRELEIIGEAASRISESARDAHPRIPWRQVMGMRTILVHEYFRIDLDIVWAAVTGDVPRLIAELEQVVPPDESS